jgi:hypothetical protein
MVTVLQDGGFRIVIYLNDHEPAHVHAVKGSGEAKIDIATGVELVSAFNLKKAEVRRAVAIVAENQELLLARWNEIHG